MTTAAVIGSGFGGLALAIRLQSAGIQTTLIEARDKPGGRAYVFEDDGFKFDAGPTVITDPTCLTELWELSGRKLSDYVELMPVAPFYRLMWEDGYVFDYSNDEKLLNEQIAAKNPKDVEGYAKFFEFSENVFREGYEQLGHEAFLDFRTMLKAAPQMIKYEAYRSVYSMVARYIEDPQLRQAFSFHSLLVGGNPFKTSSIYALIHALEKKWGVWFPRGGTHALVRGMIKLFEDLGGTVRIGSKVETITADSGRVTGVRTADGWSGRFDAVASNGDVVHTYKDMLGGHPRGQAMARAMERRSWSPSLFVIYFGLKGERPDVKHHTILFGERYKELLADSWRRISRCICTTRPQPTRGWRRRDIADFMCCRRCRIAASWMPIGTRLRRLMPTRFSMRWSGGCCRT
jgi:phytoene desaturase